MGEIFPLDLPSIFLREIKKDAREPDGKLHCSSDLTSPLRHTQLRALGVPTKARNAASSIRLKHGWLWHEWFHITLIQNHIPFFHEIKLDEFLPEGWSGTADWVFWHPEYEAFVLGDLKTTKGENIYWINTRGAKDDHIWQLSAYYYALLGMGLPMVKGFGIMYWPMNDVSGENPAPILQECSPLPQEKVGRVMEARRKSVEAIMDEMGSPGQLYKPGGLERLTELLAPEGDREQKLKWNYKQHVFDVVLTPHWSTKFCDWEPPLCSCSLQGQTKIGHFTLEGEYIARKGYESESPVVNPTEREISRRLREAENAGRS